MRSGLMVSMWAAVAVMVHKEVFKLNRAPRPENFVYIALIWTALGFLADTGGYELATVFGWGLVIAMIYTYVLRGEPILGKRTNTPRQEGNTAERRS